MVKLIPKERQNVNERIPLKICFLPGFGLSGVRPKVESVEIGAESCHRYF